MEGRRGKAGTLAEKRVEIGLEWAPAAALRCPECGVGCVMKDYLPERSWRHLDVMQFETVLRAWVPRADCREHGVKTVRVPWAGVGSRLRYSSSASRSTCFWPAAA